MRMLAKRFALQSVKSLIIICPVFTFTVAFTTIVFGIANHLESNRTHHPRHLHRVGRPLPETMETKVEKSGICDRLNGNDVESNNLPGGSVLSVNDTVRSICRSLQYQMAEYFRPRDKKVNPFPHRFLVAADHVCNDRTELVVLIHSLHTYYERRKAIRETWGGAIKRMEWPRNISLYADDIKLVFVLGIHKNSAAERHLAEESLVYGDIVQGDFYEDYHNMTLKSLLGLKWVSEHCKSAKYLVKSDDDMIINFPYLTKVLGELDMKWAIMGPYNPVSKVYRKGKWSIPIDKYPFYFYPPYESGSAYVISGDLIQPLLELSDYVEHIFIDDVYITGILGKILKVKHIRHAGFAFWTDKRPEVCDIISNKILTGTKMKPKDMWNLWVELNRNSTRNC